MEERGAYEGTTYFQLVKLCLELKDEMVALKTFAKMFSPRSSDRLSDEWINGQQVMRILHISKVTLQTYRDKGTLPFTTINGKIYYKLADVDALLKSNYRKVNNKK